MSDGIRSVKHPKLQLQDVLEVTEKYGNGHQQHDYGKIKQEDSKTIWSTICVRGNELVKESIDAPFVYEVVKVNLLLVPGDDLNWDLIYLNA